MVNHQSVMSVLENLRQYLHDQGVNYLENHNLPVQEWEFFDNITSLDTAFLRFINGLVDRGMIPKAQKTQKDVRGHMTDIVRLEDLVSIFDGHHRVAMGFHGTSSEDNAYSILTNGWDPLMRQRAAFGNGDYHTPDLAVAKEYGPWVVLTISIQMKRAHHPQGLIYITENPTNKTSTYLLPIAVCHVSNNKHRYLKHKYPLRLRHPSRFTSAFDHTDRYQAPPHITRPFTHVTSRHPNLWRPSYSGSHSGHDAIIWSVEDDEGGWNQFDYQTNRLVEAKYQKWCQTNTLLGTTSYSTHNVDGYYFTYVVDFTQMSQHNSGTGVPRQIKREYASDWAPIQWEVKTKPNRWITLPNAVSNQIQHAAHQYYRHDTFDNEVYYSLYINRRSHDFVLDLEGFTTVNQTTGKKMQIRPVKTKGFVLCWLDDDGDVTDYDEVIDDYKDVAREFHQWYFSGASRQGQRLDYCRHNPSFPDGDSYYGAGYTDFRLSVDWGQSPPTFKETRRDTYYHSTDHYQIELFFPWDDQNTRPDDDDDDNGQYGYDSDSDY